ncbi:hypothetical protein BJ875DRAFT_436248 [Amylocarpus encephaloides]|uniref:Uncharacterized protein n=1 Tax=Amylocarpus encephaloides TaxID=45428 RepID=A0A9P7YU44_9HELO|nr:hypothetical protein BJ875DRAFT_436248 [Amylocarpus encephaloides]
MAIKDRFRRAMGRSQDSSIKSSRDGSTSNLASARTSPPQTSTPTPAPDSPTLTLTKTLTAGSILAKTLTFRSKTPAEKEAIKARKKLEEWQRKDEQEWKTPTNIRYKKHRSKQHQDVLRNFEWSFGRTPREGDSSNGSIWSGISPGQSRAGSIADGANLDRVTSAGSERTRGSFGGRNKSSTTELSRIASRADAPPAGTMP